MRTTLTLDERIAKALKSIAHQSGKPFEQVVNETQLSYCLPSHFQLLLKLIQKPPFRAAGDELIGIRFDHPALAQAQRVKAQRVLGVRLSPAAIRKVAQYLQRALVAFITFGG